MEAERPDSAIIRGVLAGDTDSFALLVRRHQHRLFAVLGPHLPHDDVAEVAQEAFLRSFRGLASLRDHAAFGAWLESIALKCCADFWRSRYRQGEKQHISLDDQQREWLDTLLGDLSRERFEAQARKREARETLDRILSHVAPEDRIVLVLLYMNEYSVAEIAERMHWSQGKVKTRVHRAKRAIRKKMEDMARY